MTRFLAILAILLAAGGAALALEPEERLDDPALEARARDLSSQLRCVVCQNQSIDESNADLAADMRRLVRKRLVAGDSDEAVRQFLVDRYGDYVLLRPPMDLRTLLLWTAPVGLVFFGAMALLVMARQRARPAGPNPLSTEERARLGGFLAQTKGPTAKKGTSQLD